MAQLSRSLFAYSNIASEAAGLDQASRSLFGFTNIASDATIDQDSRSLFGFTNVAFVVVDQSSRSLFCFSNIQPFTDLDDGLQVDLLDASLELIHILRAR